MTAGPSRQHAHRAPPPARPTIYDVAQRARVSPATVSKVLRGNLTVGRENAERVNEAVLELGYRSDPLAANLRRNRRSLIGLIVPDFSNPFFGALVTAIERLAENSGFRLVAVSTSDSPEREEAQIEALLDWRVGGMILVPSTDLPDRARRLEREGMPVLILDRVPKAPAFDGVGVDDGQAAGRMVRHFYDLGHRQLLAAATTTKYHNMAERLSGVHEMAASLPEPMTIEELFCGTGQESANWAMAERFAKRPLPAAIFALFNQGTLAALREISRRDLAIPGDISIAGFDDFEWMQVMHPPVATVIQPIEELARAAWAQLNHRLEHPRTPTVRLRLACQIDFRGSIAAPRPED